MFWNFTERQERDILADLTFASNSPPPSRDGPSNKHEAQTSLTTMSNFPLNTALSRILSPPETQPLLDTDQEEQLHATTSPTAHYGSFNAFRETEHPREMGRAGGLMVRVLKEMDVQIEDFHFEYNPRTRSPRIRDDMITSPPVLLFLFFSSAAETDSDVLVFAPPLRRSNSPSPTQ